MHLALDLRRPARAFLPGLALVTVGVASALAGPGPDTTELPGHALARQLEDVFVQVAARVEPSVVTIQAYRHDPDWYAEQLARAADDFGWRVRNEDLLRYQDHRPVGIGGSGFVMHEDGYLMSLRQVVLDPDSGEPADILDVELLGNVHHEARLVAAEPTIDLAILQIFSPTPIPPLPLTNSSAVKPGQWAIGFGDPEGSERTFAVGHVSLQPMRDCYQDELSATYLQTSLHLPRGARGGPVTTLDGEVIGIATSPGWDGTADAERHSGGEEYSVPLNSGYALPINLASAIWKSLLFRESRRSPWLGISVRPLDLELRRTFPDPPRHGIYIDNVFVPSPASELGIEVGDVLLRLDGEDIRNPYDFQRILYRVGADGETTVEVVTPDGDRIEERTVIRERPPEATTR